MASEGGAGSSTAQAIGEKTLVTVVPLGPKSSPTCKVSPAPAQVSAARKNVPTTSVASSCVTKTTVAPSSRALDGERPSTARSATATLPQRLAEAPKTAAAPAAAPSAKTSVVSTAAPVSRAAASSGSSATKAAAAPLAAKSAAPPTSPALTSTSKPGTSSITVASASAAATPAAGKAKATAAAPPAAKMVAVPAVPSAAKAVSATQAAASSSSAPKTTAVSVGPPAGVQAGTKTAAMQAAAVPPPASAAVPVLALDSDGSAAQNPQAAAAAPLKPRMARPPKSKAAVASPLRQRMAATPRGNRSTPPERASTIPKQPSLGGPRELPSLSEIPFTTGGGFWIPEQVPGAAPAAISRGRTLLTASASRSNLTRLPGETSSSVRVGNVENISQMSVIRDVPRRADDGSHESKRSKPVVRDIFKRDSIAGPTALSATATVSALCSPPRTRDGAAPKLNTASVLPATPASIGGPVTTMRAQPLPAQTTQAKQPLQTSQAPQATQARSCEAPAGHSHSTPSPTGMRMARTLQSKTSSWSPIVLRSKSPVARGNFLRPTSVECRAVIIADGQHWNFAIPGGATVNDTISKITEEVVQHVGADGKRSLGEKLLVSAVPSITDAATATVADWAQQNLDQPPLIIIESRRNDGLGSERPDVGAQMNEVMKGLMHEHRKMLHALQDNEGELSSIIQTQSQFISDLQAKTQQHTSLLGETLEMIEGDIADMRADILHLEECMVETDTEGK